MAVAACACAHVHSGHGAHACTGVPDGCTWGNGTGSADVGSLGARAQSTTPNSGPGRLQNHHTKTGHVHICTQVVRASALAVVRHSTPNPQNHHEVKKHTAAAMARHRGLGGLSSHACCRRNFLGTALCHRRRFSGRNARRVLHARLWRRGGPCRTLPRMQPMARRMPACLMLYIYQLR